MVADVDRPDASGIPIGGHLSSFVPSRRSSAGSLAGSVQGPLDRVFAGNPSDQATLAVDGGSRTKAAVGPWSRRTSAAACLEREDFKTLVAEK